MVAHIICADPPWPFEDKLPGEARGAKKHYKLLGISEIMRMPLPRIADHAVLFLWRVSSMVPEAYDVVRAWGFLPKSEIVWNKTDGKGSLSLGMGRIVRGSHETCIVAVRGKGIEPQSKKEKTSFLAPRGKHSEKPEEFYQLVERLYPLELWPEPHVELFARRRRRGWLSFGDELPPEVTTAWGTTADARAQGWPCILCKGTGETHDQEGVSMACPVAGEAWHTPPLPAVVGAAAEQDEPMVDPTPSTPPREVAIPVAFLGQADNEPGEGARKRRRKTAVSVEDGDRIRFDVVTHDRFEISINDLVEPPARRSGSWKSVIRSVREVEAAARGSDHARNTPAAATLSTMPENLSALAGRLEKMGYSVPLPELSAMTPLHRSVAQSFAEQGGDPPSFLVPYQHEAF